MQDGEHGGNTIGGQNGPAPDKTWVGAGARNSWAAVATIGVSVRLFEQAFLSDMVARDRINHARRSVDHSAQLVAGVRQELTDRAGLAEAHRTVVMAERHAALTDRG